MEIRGKKEIVMNRDELLALLVKAVYVLIIALILGVIGLGVYAQIEYGGKPINEIPAWALRFLLR